MIYRPWESKTQDEYQSGSGTQSMHNVRRMHSNDLLATGKARHTRATGSKRLSLTRFLYHEATVSISAHSQLVCTGSREKLSLSKSSMLYDNPNLTSRSVKNGVYLGIRTYDTCSPALGLNSFVFLGLHHQSV